MDCSDQDVEKLVIRLKKPLWQSSVHITQTLETYVTISLIDVKPGLNLSVSNVFFGYDQLKVCLHTQG